MVWALQSPGPWICQSSWYAESWRLGHQTSKGGCNRGIWARSGVWCSWISHHQVLQGRREGEPQGVFWWERSAIILLHNIHGLSLCMDYLTGFSFWLKNISNDFKIINKISSKPDRRKSVSVQTVLTGLFWLESLTCNWAVLMPSYTVNHNSVETGQWSAYHEREC